MLNTFLLSDISKNNVEMKHIVKRESSQTATEFEDFNRIVILF